VCVEGLIERISVEGKREYIVDHVVTIVVVSKEDPAELGDAVARTTAALRGCVEAVFGDDATTVTFVSVEDVSNDSVV
jgi:hypothetical protein